MRNIQYKGLLNFYNNYIFIGIKVFFIISKMSGYYYYGLLLAFEKDFNLENFKKIFLKDLNFDCVQNLFNFKRLKSYYFRENREDVYDYVTDKAKKN